MGSERRLGAQHDDLLVLVVELGNEGVDLGRAEAQSEAPVLVRGQVLLREEEHQVLAKRSTKRLEDRIAHIREVHPVNLGTQGTAHRPQLGGLAGRNLRTRHG
jgi:hypothetical protein